MDRIAAVSGVVACALAACSHSAGTDTSGSAPAVAHVGRAAPPWSEPSLPGPSLSLASLRGRPIYLNFFATWCPPCNEEAPQIDALARKYAPRGLAVVGVDVLENATKAAEFRKAHQLTYPVLVDSGILREEYRVNGLPVHVFIDRAGIVRSIIVGELSPAGMRENVARILQ